MLHGRRLSQKKKVEFFDSSCAGFGALNVLCKVKGGGGGGAGGAGGGGSAMAKVQESPNFETKDFGSKNLYLTRNH